MIKKHHPRRLFAYPFVACVLAIAAAGSSRADIYSSVVQTDNPKAYYRFNDDNSRSAINHNRGSLGSAGNATNDLGVLHSMPGALAGDRNRAAFFDFTARTEIPWSAALNPPNTQPFTVEAWFYPTSDQTGAGQCPINNRYAYSGVDRQGWVFFQRKPDETYEGGEPVGWNFRMFRGSGSSSGLDVTSLVPYQLGKWTHVVVVYDPVQVTNATITMYIDGVAANTNVWNGGAEGTDPGYVANTNDHPSSESPAGPAELALGNYNNTALGSLNPYFGGVDEFAFYSAKLTPAQIFAHYKNATDPNRSTPYETLVLSDNPVAYLRLDEIPPAPDGAVNHGDARAAANATHTAEVRHPAASALAGQPKDGSAAYHYRNGTSTTTIPWIIENNPEASVPFTFETWIRPMSDKQGGQAAFNNRWVGGTGRTGWVIFQRNPNESYPASEGLGWNFRMYSGDGNGGQDVLTGTDYQIGEWSHLVVTWEPQVDNGDPAGNGNHQFQGILTAYFNGVPVATNDAALYAANVSPTEAGTPPSDLAIGSYNAASGIGNNPFEGDVDEFAFYSDYVLKPEQILEHYQAGKNAGFGTNYETLVLTAPFSGPERKGPKTYLRFNDPADFAAANSGTLGYLADGNLMLTGNTATGPRPPTFGGLDEFNAGVPLNGAKQWAGFNNPVGLNIAGQVTLEAWIKPGATQGDLARIISHGPPTPSSFLTVDPPVETNATVLNGNEVFLRIEGGTNYVVGSSDGTNIHGASFPIPAGDLGGAEWIYLAGTYDGANWNLYRNGSKVASAASLVGALPLENNGDWAVGATGNGWADNYAGDVDEVAIYNVALSSERILAHYGAARATPILRFLVISREPGGKVKISWSTGTTLQESTAVTGPYSDVPGSPVSPLVIDPVGTKFYRLKP